MNTVYRLPYILPLINNQLYQSYFKPLFNKKHNITIVQSKDPEKEFIEEIEKEIIQNEGESLALYKNRKNKHFNDIRLNNLYFTDDKLDNFQNAT